MVFAATHYNAVTLLVNHADVKVLMLYLLGGVQSPISFDICLGGGKADIRLLNVLPVRLDSLRIVGTQSLVQAVGEDPACRHTIHAHAVQTDATESSTENIKLTSL